MITYIKKSVPNSYVTFEEELDSELYSNIGETWQDYLANKWVKLSDEQVAFRDENPNARVYEVWKMSVAETRVVSELEEAIADKVREIEMYNDSDRVNTFKVNGSLSAWLTVAERSNYRSSIEAAKIVGEESLNFYIGDSLLSLSIASAEGMLAQIQRYADNCFIVTKQHIAAVKAMENVDDVKAFDITADYPEVLNFTIAVSDETTTTAE